ncbi:endo alpha-1,4 polygalactosaminidase [Photobacterium nomapromontoriensis]|uniref:endo alpha-1,4 polygalactosaminidase n=1 Tax=Photobacterium nomapromontoriensis TaxID=2910237 RepID=UPI003D0DE7AA
MRKFKLILAVQACALVGLLGCDTASSNNEEAIASDLPDAQASAGIDPISIDPATIAPVTGGSWYQPAVLSTWQWQLNGNMNTSYDVDIYDIDLFDASEALIQQLQAKNIKVICYFSAGSYEEWRDDAKAFEQAELGHALDGWPGERWLDIRSSNVLLIMKDRLDLAVQKGCDGVEPDNVDGYTNKTGFDLTANDQLTFNRLIANEAHARNLSVGLKNNLDQVNELVDYYDFAVNEQCFEYQECQMLTPFIDKGKAVLNAEYDKKYINNKEDREAMCTKSREMQFSTLILPLDLDDTFRMSCL